MATLASGILTRYQALMATPSQTDQSNPRDDDSSPDSTLLTAASEQAADELTPILGSVTDADTEAVALGYRLMKLVLNDAALVVPSPEFVNGREQVLSDARELRDARRQENTDGMRWHAPDTTGRDARYPAAADARGYTRSTGYRG